MTTCGGALLNRGEAIKVLKEIFEKCTICDGNWLSIMPPGASNILSRGYQLHLKFPLDEESKKCMKEILEKYDLALMYKKEQELIIIYRPKK